MATTNNPFQQFANCVHELRSLVRTPEVVGRYFGSADNLYRAIASLSQELQSPTSVRNALQTKISEWHTDTLDAIYDYGTITVGNKSAAFATTVVGWIPIAGQLLLISQMIAEACCKSEIERRQSRVLLAFQQAEHLFAHHGSGIIFKGISEFPEEDHFQNAAAAILGVAKLLSLPELQRGYRGWVTAETVRMTIEQVAELHGIFLDAPNRLVVIEGNCFRLNMDVIASRLRIAELTSSLVYLCSNRALGSFSWMSRITAMRLISRQFGLQFAAQFVQAIKFVTGVIVVVGVIFSAIDLSDAVKTRDQLYEKANEAKQSLDGLVDTMQRQLDIIRNLN